MAFFGKKFFSGRKSGRNRVETGSKSRPKIQTEMPSKIGSKPGRNRVEISLNFDALRQSLKRPKKHWPQKKTLQCLCRVCNGEASSNFAGRMDNGETMNSERFYRLYGKGPRDKKFAALNINTGERVANLFYANFLNEEQAQVQRDNIVDYLANNPGWNFEVREVK